MNLGPVGKLIGAITALAESDLYMHASNVYPLSLMLPHDKVGRDKNSLGLFQQRLEYWGWGSEDERVRQLMDPATSTRLFFTGLTRVQGWRTMYPWMAAQIVQRSSFDGIKAIDPKTGKPYPYGQNYRDRMETAQKALAYGPRFFTDRK